MVGVVSVLVGGDVVGGWVVGALVDVCRCVVVGWLCAWGSVFGKLGWCIGSGWRRACVGG